MAAPSWQDAFSKRDRWAVRRSLRSFVPAAVFAWFGLVWVDLRVMAVAAAFAGLGYWHARRRAVREPADDEEDDLL